MRLVPRCGGTLARIAMVSGRPSLSIGDAYDSKSVLVGFLVDSEDLASAA